MGEEWGQVLDLLVDGSSSFAALFASARLVAPQLTVDGAGAVRDLWKILSDLEAAGMGMVADRDAVFFEYLERETSATIGRMFRGFSGYVQVDAKRVFDILFRRPRRVGARPGRG